MLVLFQSSKVLERPWCLLELYTAVMEGVPIVARNCAGKGYDFGKSADLLLHLETKLSKLNPSAVQVLKQDGVDPLHAAHVLSSAIPNIISVHLNTSASRIAIKATMVDLVKAMQSAQPFPVETALEDWLASRGELDEKVTSIKDISGTVKGQMMAKAGRADELAKEIVELKRAMESERAEFKSREAKSSEIVAERVAELKSREVESKQELKEERAERKAERAKSETKIEKLEAKIEKLEAKIEHARG